MSDRSCVLPAAARRGAGGGGEYAAAPYGYDLYYLNVMAGPLRKWRFQNHPDHDWIFQRDG